MLFRGMPNSAVKHQRGSAASPNCKRKGVEASSAGGTCLNPLFCSDGKPADRRTMSTNDDKAIRRCYRLKSRIVSLPSEIIILTGHAPKLAHGERGRGFSR